MINWGEFKWKTIVFALAGCLICFLFLYLVEKLYPDTSTEKSVAVSILTAAISACVVSGFLDAFLKVTYASNIQNLISSTIKTETINNNPLYRDGVVNTYATLSEADRALNLYNKIEAEAKEIKILLTWFPNMISYQRALENMKLRGGTAKVLCLRETSQITKIRSPFTGTKPLRFDDTHKEIRYSQDVNHIKANRETIVEIFGKESFRHYDEMPAFCLYIVGDIILMSHYLFYRNAFESRQLEIVKDSIYGKDLIEYFDELWDMSEKLTE